MYKFDKAWWKAFGFASVGLGISFFEMILTTVYQFQLLGFALSLIVIVASTIYIVIRYQEYKLREKNALLDSIENINEEQSI